MSEALVAERNNVELSRFDQANAIVKNYILASFVPSVLPIPLVDIALISGIQLKMLHSLSNLYDIKFSKDLGKEAIASLVGGAMPVFFAPVMVSLIKVIPVLGQAAGTVSLFTLGGGSTYAVGKVFIQHFESGGTFLTFDPDKVKEYFAQEFEQGKKVVSTLKAEQANDSSVSVKK